MVTISAQIAGSDKIIEFNNISTFLFDLDGTLIDSLDLHIEAFQWILDKLGKDIPREDLEPLMGKTPQDIISKFFSDMSREELLHAASEKEDKLAEIIEEVYVYPGIVEFLQELNKHNVNCLVISSTHKKLVKILLQKAGLWDFLSDLVSGDEVLQGKPHPEPFQRGITKSGSSPDEVIAIGDSIHDFKSAKDAGTHFIGILTGKTNVQEFRDVGLDVLIESIDNLTITQ